MSAFLCVMVKDNTTGKTYIAADTCLSGNVTTAAGVHKIIWNIGAQGIPINSNNASFSVMYCDEVYVVIDLSAGANATSYTSAYLYAIPSGGWTDAYKTSKLVLRRISPGSFKMGGAYNVTLTKSFCMGIFEVTQKQYQLVMGVNSTTSSGDKLPANVSYNTIRGSSNGAKWPTSSAVDSDSFVGKLRARTGLNFELPTEAQWEYTCRAGSATIYYWGDSMNGNYAWYYDNSSSQSQIVGTKTPNAWGLYDMSGNVLEWCLDWSGSLSSGMDPKGASSGSYRVARGGFWYSSATRCTSSYREENYPPSWAADSRIGFRLCLPLAE